jgi:hypothetical protein
MKRVQYGRRVDAAEMAAKAAASEAVVENGV